jgi:hypothetical protein
VKELGKKSACREEHLQLILIISTRRSISPEICHIILITIISIWVFIYVPVI